MEEVVDKLVHKLTSAQNKYHILCGASSAPGNYAWFWQHVTCEDCEVFKPIPKRNRDEVIRGERLMFEES